MTLEYVMLSGTLGDGSGGPVQGNLAFWPSQWLTDTVTAVIPPSPVAVQLSASGRFSVALLATDNTEPMPGSWLWNVRISIAGTPVRAFTFPLPHSAGASQDFAAIVPVPPSDVTSSYTAGGDLSGTYPDPTVAKIQGTAVAVPPTGGGATADFLRADGTWHVPYTPPLPIPVAQGGTNGTTQQGAINSLTGTQAAGRYLRSDGTNAALTAIQASDVPTLNQSTTGTAGGLSALLAVSQGGTGSPAQNFSPLLTMTTVKTSGYSAAAGDYVRADATSGSLTVTLPSAPADLSAVAVKMTGTAGTGTVTVQCQGSDVLDKAGGGTAYVLSLLSQGAVFQYSAASGIWLVTAGSLSLGQLDARYPRTAPVTLADAATIAVDASLGNHFTVTLGGSRTLGTPSNPAAGQEITIQVIQDATGSRTLAYSAAWAFGTDVPPPTLTTTPAKRDFLRFAYDPAAAKWFCVAVSRGY